MTYGFTRNRETNEITGEQDVLRYSALNLWLTSKAGYRERYYEGKSYTTPEMMFGHKVHKAIENGETVLEGLPVYTVPEYNIEIEAGGVRIGGCIDSFDPETLSFLDYKSSHLSKTGVVPWDKVKVQRHMQLVFYSLLIKLKHKKVNPITKLVWLETEFINKTSEFDGHTLEAESRELRLTGKFEVFTRRIAAWERTILLETIKRCAAEINEDFLAYKLKT